MPVSLVNSGTMCSRRPEFSTEVVEASTIASSARLASPANRAEPIRIAAASFPLTTTVLPWRRRAKIVALTAMLIPIRTRPRPSASDRLPLLVSSTIAVVIVRV